MRLASLLLIVPAIAWAVQLPPDMEADRFLLQAETAIEEQDFEQAKSTMDRILELQAVHNLELPEQFSFRYAQVLERLGLYDEAMETATRYLTLAGREGEFYREALQLINAAEAGKAAALEAADAARAAAEAETKAATEAATRLAGETRMFDGMEFVWVPAGEFRMGSTSAEAGDDEQPVTPVRISRGLRLGKYEVTQAEWLAVMPSNRSDYAGCGSCPVKTVSWYDVQEFVRLLNGRADGNLYRLPTEAEWEYAARAGTTGDRYGNLDAIGWCDMSSLDRTPRVGQKAANAWGLHDMIGNVWEWVQDPYGNYPGVAVTDPRGSGSGSEGVYRGGSWWGDVGYCRAPSRDNDDFATGGNLLGFRVARTGH